MLVGLFVVVALVDPNRPGRYPTCPVLELTGFACPGCGSLRAVRALAQGDIVTALDRNAAGVVFLAVAVVAWVRALAGRPQLPDRWQRPAALASLVLLTMWTVVRNLPFPPFDVLAP